MDTKIIVAALFPIYVGAHAALSRPSSAKRSPRARAKSQNDVDEEEDQGLSALVSGGSKLQASDAVFLPLFAGLILGLFYWIITSSENGAKILNQVLGIHVALTGTVFLRTFLNDTGKLLRSFLFPTRYSCAGKYWIVHDERHQFVASNDDSAICTSPFPGFLRHLPNVVRLNAAMWKLRDLLYCKLEFCFYIRNTFSIESILTPIGIFSSASSLGVIYYFTFIHKYWWLTNLIGTASAYGAMTLMSPSTFATGSLILGVLFFYDIYMVFYTPMMVTVATKLDIPAKLLFPKKPTEEQPPGTRPMSMLGLGDVVIPGMMIALALKFDLYLFYLKKQTKRVTEQGEVIEQVPYINATGGWGERFWCRRSTIPPNELEKADARAFPKTYFHASIFGYILAMMTCGFWMAVYNHPQPALLYLVPGVLGAIWSTALIKGDLRTMLDYSDISEAEEEGKGQVGEEKKKEEEGSLNQEKQTENKKRLQRRCFSWFLSAIWRSNALYDWEEREKDKSKAKKESEAKTDPSKSTYLIKFYIRLPPKQTHKIAERGVVAEDGMIEENKIEELTQEDSSKGIATLEYVSIDNTRFSDEKPVSAPKRRKMSASKS
ncbi:hypothetical protein KEM54_000197 [Ascosphaera aggregata]|nr:hypothetical protein KEM54_000197 [Ascosphaera aggregata]